MSARSWPSRIALWAAACVLLLKAAVPMLASTAAGLQGKSVAEVCTVYGVALPSAQQDPHAHHGHHGHVPAGEHPPEHGSAAHGGDHCALTTLTAFAAAGDTPLAVPPARVSRTIALPDTPAAPARVAWTAAQPRGPPRV